MTAEHSGWGELDIDGAPIAVVVGHSALRQAARDWRRYTSATPFRVPIPEESALRPVRQYPIETDPPEHTAYRAAIADRFDRRSADAIRPHVEDLVDDVFDAAARRGRLSVVDELAIPVVSTGIAHTLGRPDDADLIASWGLHVFSDPETGARRRNADLDRYLAERVDASIAEPAADLFGDLARATVLGRSLTRDEMLGYGYLVLAGGRDTVISAIAGATWYLAAHPDVRHTLAAGQVRITTAVEEFLRFFSPLGFIGRTVTETGELVALGFAAANHDPSAFEQPDEIHIDRSPNRHVAFGHGPHTCIGAPLARMQLAVVVERFVRRFTDTVRVIAPESWRPVVDRELSTGSYVPLDLEIAVN
ncbi:MAG: cytochrome P450 [Ilumatobacteraceae bacterium]